MSPDLNDNRMDQDLKPDPRLRSLLQSVEPKGGVLPWAAAREIVHSAPPVQVAWYTNLINFSNVRLRYAAAPLLLLLTVTILAAMPAQSGQVGTLVLTRLPLNWDIGGEAFNEVENAAQAAFTRLDIPQSELYLKVGTEEGRPKLAFAMIGVSQGTSADFFGELARRFPALAVSDEEYRDISGGQYDNKLEELWGGITRGFSGGTDKTDNELRLEVFKSLKNAGFDDIQIDVTRDADGTVYIEVDAAMRFAVEGRSQEELEAAGLDEELLGESSFEQLLEELAATE